MSRSRNSIFQPGRFALVCSLALFAGPAAQGSSAQSLSPPLSDPVHDGLQISDPTAQGYVAEEYLLRGTAPVLEPVTMADAEDTMGIDNTALMSRQPSYASKVITPDQPYVTRVIVYRPADLKRFSGDVVVETMHPAGGGQAIVWSSINPYITKRGHAYVIVQHPATFDGLRQADPQRYADLSAKASSQVWGMLADAGRLLKTTGIGGIKARHLFMTGYSFTGVATATFADYHHDSSRLSDGSPIYDGYFPMAAGMYVKDLDVPVMVMMTNSDFNIFGSVNNRKPDSDKPGSKFRLYEIAGPSHSTARLPEAGSAVPPKPIKLPEGQGMPQFSPQTCFAKFPEGYKPNDFPTRLVQAALLNDLIAWVDKGTPPPPGARIEIDAQQKPIVDANGNALGGVRLPPITEPTKTYGMGPGEACFIFGYSLPFPPDKLKQLYGSHAAYVARVDKDAQAMVKRRLLLPEGAAELLALATAEPAF